MSGKHTKIESIKQVIETLRELENIDIELNKKCKQSGDDIDMLKKITTESDYHLQQIINNLI